MPQRIVVLRDTFDRELNARQQAWLRANGLDPNDAVAHSPVVVGEDVLILREFSRNDAGARVVLADGYAKHWRAVPMAVRPEVHDVDVLDMPLPQD